jgi:DNA-binding transcriptional regulator YiaG
MSHPDDPHQPDDDGLTGTEWLYQDRPADPPRSQPTAADPVSFAPPPDNPPFAAPGPGSPSGPAQPADPPRRRRRRHRGLLVVGIVLAAIVVLLFAADRITPIVVGKQVGASLKSQMSTPSRPDVSFGGFPFLTQLSAGRFETVKITATQVPVSADSKNLTVSTVRAKLHNVKTSHQNSRLHIQSLRGSAKISYAKLSSYLGVPVSAASKPGRIKLKVAGLFTVTGVPAVDRQHQTIGLEDMKFAAAGHRLPLHRLTNLLHGILQSKLPNLGDLKLSDISPHAQGIVVHGSGRDITTGG